MRFIPAAAIVTSNEVLTAVGLSHLTAKNFLPGDHWMRSIVGTWKLVHAAARDAAGAARPSPYGGKALGRVTFTADGRMMSVVCDGWDQPGIQLVLRQLHL